MDGNVKTFEESFSEFISKRLFEDLEVLLESNPAFEKAYQEMDMYRNYVKEAFAEGNKEKFEENLEKFAGKQDSVVGRVAEVSYIQGLLDDSSLAKLLEAWGFFGRTCFWRNK